MATKDGLGAYDPCRNQTSDTQSLTRRTNRDLFLAELQETEFTAYDGLALCANTYGPTDGLPVLLLHGGGQTRWSWGGTAIALAERGCRVHAVDLRGHGQSNWCPDGNYSLGHFAADIRAVVASLDRPPVIVGASLGGLSSLLACGEEPRASCAGLVLVDISPRIEEAGSSRVVDFLRSTIDGFDSLADATDAVAAYAPQRKRPPRPEGLLKNLRQSEDGRYRWHWDPAFVLRDADKESWDLAEIEAQLMQAAHSIDAPVLIVRGSESDVLSETTMNNLRVALPQAEQAVVEGASHMIAGDDNAAFNQAILPFVLKRLGEVE
jgi:pimeloyl-ACP methyl ester carboxylesterase